MQAGVVGLLKGSTVARFALPAPEVPASAATDPPAPVTAPQSAKPAPAATAPGSQSAGTPPRAAVTAPKAAERAPQSATSAAASGPPVASKSSPSPQSQAAKSPSAEQMPHDLAANSQQSSKHRSQQPVNESSTSHAHQHTSFHGAASVQAASVRSASLTANERAADNEPSLRQAQASARRQESAAQSTDAPTTSSDTRASPQQQADITVVETQSDLTSEDQAAPGQAADSQKPPTGADMRPHTGLDSVPEQPHVSAESQEQHPDPDTILEQHQQQQQQPESESSNELLQQSPSHNRPRQAQSGTVVDNMDLSNSSSQEAVRAGDDEEQHTALPLGTDQGQAGAATAHSQVAAAQQEAPGVGASEPSSAGEVALQEGAGASPTDADAAVTSLPVDASAARQAGDASASVSGSGQMGSATAHSVSPKQALILDANLSEEEPASSGTASEAQGQQASSQGQQSSAQGQQPLAPDSSQAATVSRTGPQGAPQASAQNPQTSGSTHQETVKDIEPKARSGAHINANKGPLASEREQNKAAAQAEASDQSQMAAARQKNAVGSLSRQSLSEKPDRKADKEGRPDSTLSGMTNLPEASGETLSEAALQQSEVGVRGTAAPVSSQQTSPAQSNVSRKPSSLASSRQTSIKTKQTQDLKRQQTDFNPLG